MLLEPERRHEDRDARHAAEPGARPIQHQRARERCAEEPGIRVRRGEVALHHVVCRGEEPCRHDAPPGASRLLAHDDEDDERAQRRGQHRQEPQHRQRDTRDAAHGGSELVVERVVRQRHEFRRRRGVDRHARRCALDVLQHRSFHQVEVEREVDLPRPQVGDQHQVGDRDHREERPQHAAESGSATERQQDDGDEDRGQQRQPHVQEEVAVHGAPSDGVSQVATASATRRCPSAVQCMLRGWYAQVPPRSTSRRS